MQVSSAQSNASWM